MQISHVSRGQCTNNLDEPNLDIMMEHQELSDSDDESENDEFECEEIDARKRMTPNFFNLEKLIIRGGMHCHLVPGLRSYATARGCAPTDKKKRCTTLLEPFPFFTAS